MYNYNWPIANQIARSISLQNISLAPVADPEFHNGGTVEGEGSREGAVLNFYLKMVGFGAF